MACTQVMAQGYRDLNLSGARRLDRDKHCFTTCLFTDIFKNSYIYKIISKSPEQGIQHICSIRSLTRSEHRSVTRSLKEKKTHFWLEWPTNIILLLLKDFNFKIYKQTLLSYYLLFKRYWYMCRMLTTINSHWNICNILKYYYKIYKKNVNIQI